MTGKRKPFEFNGQTIAPGEQVNIDLRAAQLYTHTELHIPVEIIHGRQDGPVLLVCAAIHGDELNGVETIRRLLKKTVLKRIKGTLMVVPIVNVFGFIHGSLRSYADKKGISAITYEAGEALRFDEAAIAAGVKGVLNVMRGLGMLQALKKPPKEPVVARSSKWIRAMQDAIIYPAVRLGSHVKRGDTLATISAPLGIAEKNVKAPGAGIVIGSTTLPLVNEGEAVFHITQFLNTEKVAQTVQDFHDELQVEENKIG